VTGGSARARLAGLVTGRVDPATLAELATGRLRTQRPAFERALVPRSLAASDCLDDERADLDGRRAELERPDAAAVERLDGRPGVGLRAAQALSAAVGPTVARVPAAQHLAAWAGRWPGHHERAGKRLSGKTRQGNAPRRRALVQAGQAAGRARGT